MALQKCCLCRGGNEQKSDSRWYVREQIVMSGLDVLLKLLYPSLMILTNMDSQVQMNSRSYVVLYIY